MAIRFELHLKENKDKRVLVQCFVPKRKVDLNRIEYSEGCHVESQNGS